MRRRDFLKILSAGIIVGGLAPTRILAQITESASSAGWENHDDYIKDYLHKIRNFNKPHKDDVFLNRKEYQLLQSSVKRLMRLERTVGHGNFQVLGFDEMRKFANIYPQVGQFPKAELDFLESIFYQDATIYGFFGEKPVKNISHRIPASKVVKVPYTGNYLYNGRSLELYKKINRDIGDRVILTSGVRSIIKQFLLFLKKAYKNDGNLSLASRSLAPPGCSYHGIGDFDVGQVGLGAANFTARFATTEVFRRLEDLGHINLRYPQDNLLGVRFEPWHIKVVL